MKSHLLRRRIGRLDPRDRRMLFRDLHMMFRPRPESPIIQFYSSNMNIGNYLPVAGIRKMAKTEPDAWCMHEPVDWDWVNSNYRAAIIGGAGLMDVGFSRFWSDCADRCQLPVTIWGVGLCLRDGDPRGSDRVAVQTVAAKADLVNVRDDLTADFYGLDDVDISACPTVAYLDGRRADGRLVAFSQHPGLVGDAEHREIVSDLEYAGHQVVVTQNIQTRSQGVDDIIRDVYSKSRAVVTTRLHGAIIAYGLGLPYVAVARDEKIRSFQRLYGGGIVVESGKDAVIAVDALPSAGQQRDLGDVYAFGAIASKWLREH